MNGYIKLYRSLLDWQWWSESETLKVWIYCLFRARWSESKYKGVSVERGSFTTTYRELAKDLKLSERKTRTALAHLSQTGEITVVSESKFTVIRVNNYEKYQFEKDPKIDTNFDTNSTQQTTQTRHAENPYFSTDSGNELKPFDTVSDTNSTQKATQHRHNTDTYKRKEERKNIIIHSPEDAERHLANIRRRLEGL